MSRLLYVALFAAVSGFSPIARVPAAARVAARASAAEMAIERTVSLVP